MKIKVDGKKVLREVEKEESDRKQVTLYLSRSLFDKFSKCCKQNKKIAASKVIEKLMEGFVDSFKKK